MSRRLVIKNGYVLTLDRKLGDFERADVLVDMGKIVSIAPDLEVEDAEVVDATDQIVMPGLIDAHRHLWHAPIRGIAIDWPLSQFFEQVPGRFGSLYRPQDLYVGNLLGALEALNSGITTILDWANILHTPDHVDEAVQGLKDAGMRGVFTYGLPKDVSFQHDDVRRIQAAHFSSHDQLLSLALGVLSPEYVPLEVVQRDIRLGRELGIPCSMHTGSGGAHGGIQKLASADLLGPDLNFAHCNTLLEEEYRLITSNGCSVTMTPEVEMQMGLGMPATRNVLDSGGRPSLGVDVVTAVSGDLFTQMRLTLQSDRAQANASRLQQGEIPESLDLTARDVLEFATIEGARALGLESKVGSLAPGKEADIVLINTTDLNVHPVLDPVAAVLHAHAGNIDSVFVAGRAVKRQGKLVHVDLDRVRKRAEASCDYLLHKAGWSQS